MSELGFALVGDFIYGQSEEEMVDNLRYVSCKFRFVKEMHFLGARVSILQSTCISTEGSVERNIKRSSLTS